MTISVPPPLAKKVKTLAKQQHQSTSELVREALRRYLTDAEREAAWRRIQAYGAGKAKKLGVRSEKQLQAILDELRHDDKPARDGKSRRR
jgi:Arc/MetJ-type ribon-helix-helix transcriptional regulator